MIYGGHRSHLPGSPISSFLICGPRFLSSPHSLDCGPALLHNIERLKSAQSCVCHITRIHEGSSAFDRKEAQINARSDGGETCLTKILLNSAWGPILPTGSVCSEPAWRALGANKSRPFSLLIQSYYFAICGWVQPWQATAQSPIFTGLCCHNNTGPNSASEHASLLISLRTTCHPFVAAPLTTDIGP